MVEPEAAHKEYKRLRPTTIPAIEMPRVPNNNRSSLERLYDVGLSPESTPRSNDSHYGNINDDFDSLDRHYHKTSSQNGKTPKSGQYVRRRLRDYADKIKDCWEYFGATTQKRVSTEFTKLENRESCAKLTDHSKALFVNTGVAFLNSLVSEVFHSGNDEQEKVFMSRNRSIALMRSAVHLIPVGASISLLVLNGRGHYIGGELSGASGQDMEKLAALTFAAKLLELSILASLGSLLITYIRKELAFGDGVPFGTLFSALQFQNIAFLWSLEMWGSICYKWERRSTKCFILSLVTLCTILGLVIGPSCTNLMKPRLDDWPAGGTVFYINCTEAVLFPEKLAASPSMSHCESDNSDLACPAGNWRILSESYYSYFPRLVDAGSLPQNITISSAASIRSFGMRSRNVRFPHKMMWADAFTLATTPLAVVADSLAELGRMWSYAAANSDVGLFQFRNDALFKVNTVQPVVSTYCAQQSVDDLNGSLPFAAFGSMSLSSGPNTAAHSSVRVAEWSYYIDRELTSKISSSLSIGNAPWIHWIDDTVLLNATSSTLAAIFILPNSTSSKATYFTCSIDSRFANVTLESTRNVVKLVSGEPRGFDQNGTFHSDWRKISLAADWARYLTPSMADTNDSILTPITSRAGIFNSSTPSEPHFREVIVENIVTTLIANGIGRSSYNYSLIMDLKDSPDPSNLWAGGEWVYDIMPEKGNMGKGGNAFNISPQVKEQSTEMVMEAFTNGYAYSSTGILKKLGMAVFAIYIALVLTHIAYTMVTGVSSGSWGTAPEIAALAWNSWPSQNMRNTGAGITSVNTYKNGVRVLQRDLGSEGRKLEMVIVSGDDMESSKLETINKNEPYG